MIFNLSYIFKYLINASKKKNQIDQRYINLNETKNIYYTDYIYLRFMDVLLNK